MTDIQLTASASKYNFDLFQGIDDIPWNNGVTSNFKSESMSPRSYPALLNSWVADFLESNNRLIESNIQIYNSVISRLTMESLLGSSKIHTATTTISDRDENHSRRISQDIHVSSDNALNLFNEKYYLEFQRDLSSSGIDEESIDFLYWRLSQLMTLNKDAALKMFQNIYLESRESQEMNVNLTLKILRIIHRFEYNDMRPFSQVIVDSAFHTKDSRIQLEALKVYDRWGNKEVLNMLEKTECPSHPWTKLKFNSLIRTLRNGLSQGT